MAVKKYKYYFKKPKIEIAKDVLYWLMVAGVVCIAASSPYFIKNLWRSYKHWKKYPRKKVYDAFYKLRRRGLINFKNEDGQIYISLTEEGRKRAGHFQINDLRIQKPSKWDKKWRIVIFDIIELKKVYREAFRGKLKELGFSQLQKSVWVHPFECGGEIELLRDFFGLKEESLRLIIAESIGGDKNLREFYRLS